jgi:excinuclease UvrABC helicase subunit UvrB
MREAAKKFEFERAAQIRDRVKGLRARGLELRSPEPAATL